MTDTIEKSLSSPYIALIRPKQWIKQGFVLAPLIFSFAFQRPEAWYYSIIAVIAFTAAASATYIFNDINDIKSDRNHPVKQSRPLASGAISIRNAYITMLIILGIGGFTSLLLPSMCLLILISYIVLNILYTLFLKKIAILDVVIVASGFVLRVLMGGYAINVSVSPWIITATFMIALFIGFGKRRHELILVKNQNHTRESLHDYNSEFIDKLINVTCSAALICYAIYAVEQDKAHNKVGLVYTVAFVAFGLFRYLQSIYLSNQGGEPEQILFKDRIFQINLLLWLITTLWIMS